MLNSDTEVCVLCGEVGHIGVDCGANICILCLETGHWFNQCGEIGDDLEDRDGDNGKEQNMPVEIVHDDYAENVTIQFDEKMSSLKLMWKSSASKIILQTFKEDFCGLCFIPFPSVDIALLHYKGSIHNISMKDQMQNKHPSFWKIVLRVVEVKGPKGAYKQDIFQMMVEQYEMDRLLTAHEIYQKIKEILVDMVGKYKLLIKDGGRYRLRKKVSWDNELLKFFHHNMEVLDEEKESLEDTRNSKRKETIKRREQSISCKKRKTDTEGGRRRNYSMEHSKKSRRSEENIEYRRSSKRHRPSSPYSQSPYHHPIPTPPHSGAGSTTPIYRRNLGGTPSHSFPSPSPSPVRMYSSWTRSEGRRSRS